MTRAEHLEWAKKRALDYIDRGDDVNGVASMLSDMRKHPELVDHFGLQLAITLRTPEEARDWVEGFR